MKSINKKLLAMAIAVAVSGEVAAYEVGDIIVRAGYAAVDPRESSSAIKVDGDPAPLDGVNVGVNGNAQLGLTASYIFAPHWGVEVLAATPFKHDIYLNEAGLKLGSTKQLPPTVSAQYYILEPNSAWQPYVGLGLNYTKFFSESVSNDAKSALGASDLHLKDSYGLAAEAGVDWLVDKNWVVNASVWRTQIRSEASVKINDGANKVTTKVTIDPWVYMVAVGYKF